MALTPRARLLMERRLAASDVPTAEQIRREKMARLSSLERLSLQPNDPQLLEKAEIIWGEIGRYWDRLKHQIEPDAPEAVIPLLLACLDVGQGITLSNERKEALANAGKILEDGFKDYPALLCQARESLAEFVPVARGR